VDEAIFKNDGDLAINMYILSSYNDTM